MNKAFPISMTVLFFIALFLVSSDMRYARKVKLAFIVLLRMLRHGGSQPRKEEGASHPARRGKNAEAFLNFPDPGSVIYCRNTSV